MNKSYDSMAIRALADAILFETTGTPSSFASIEKFLSFTEGKIRAAFLIDNKDLSQALASYFAQREGNGNLNDGFIALRINRIKWDKNENEEVIESIEDNVIDVLFINRENFKNLIISINNRFPSYLKSINTFRNETDPDRILSFLEEQVNPIQLSSALLQILLTYGIYRDKAPQIDSAHDNDNFSTNLLVDQDNFGLPFPYVSHIIRRGHRIIKRLFRRKKRAYH